MPYTRTVCMCHVDKNLPVTSIPSLTFCKEKRNPANLFTFSKCQDKLGGLRVSAQSARQLFYKKNIRVDFFFLRPLDSPEDRAAPPPKKTWISLARRGGWVLLLEERAAARPPLQADSGLCTRPVGLGTGVAAPVELGQVGLVVEGEAWRGSHPRMRSRTLAVSLFPLS